MKILKTEAKLQNKTIDEIVFFLLQGVSHHKHQKQKQR